MTYEQLANLSEGLTGGDIRHIVFKICIRLYSKRMARINEESMKAIIDIYKHSIDQTQSSNSEIEIVTNKKY